MRDILQKEADTCPESWKAGLQEDLQWLYGIRGSEWGQDFLSTSTLWEQGKTGWKAFVKGAQKRHILQESIAFVLQQRGGARETAHVVTNEEDGWLCGCGAWFQDKKSLKVHQHKKHGIHNEIYQMIAGTTCPMCLLQLWTTQRLQTHLSYQPRGGKGNRCFSLLSALCFKREESTASGKEIPLKGIQRRDAVRCEGPLRFGMDPDDEVLAEQRVAYLEGKLGGREVENLTDFLDQGLHDNILFVLSEETDWEEKWDELEQMSKGRFQFLVNLLFCGGRFQWESREDQGRWRAYTWNVSHMARNCVNGLI